MKTTYVNKVNLRKGIEKRAEYPHWDQDFHNGLYRKLFLLRECGFNRDYWRFLVDELYRWRAGRGSLKKDIFDFGLGYLPLLEDNFRFCANNHKIEPDISSMIWDEIGSLFHLALQIKRTNTPSIVFASKLCHFIMPDVFIPVDSVFNPGVTDEQRYRIYWQDCQVAWIKCGEKDELKKILSARIGAGLIDKFPFSTKIIELCSSVS